MRCSASPTTCSVASVPRPSDAREVAAQFEAMLMQSAFAPLAASLGFYGDAVVGSVAREVARDARGGLGDALERQLALGGRP